jgi:hypothetical protein
LADPDPNALARPWPAGEFPIGAANLPIKLGRVFNGCDGHAHYEVFEAFKSAGAPDEKARKAAEALSGAAFAEELSKLKSAVKLHPWLLGFNTAMLTAMLLRLFAA